MRLWSLHPSLLDSKGLVACWRETLLAQKVLAGQSQGYANHPQLIRLRAQADPLESVGRYLQGLLEEARTRGYNFDATKIQHPALPERAGQVPVTIGQIEFETAHLLRKLKQRDPSRATYLASLETGQIPLHPLFTAVPGLVEAWEKDPAVRH
ncbi:pyrimidine dimer DNA glycosylase/endonuclease V [Glutamicibacter protophormiae]|uniref:pyrimidine dimer DNA glycosylase/endonuclease V n=1 Tax=Glutamicibacter protophormiae TaxID=37930 RepID=UPI0033251F9C